MPVKGKKFLAVFSTAVMLAFLSPEILPAVTFESKPVDPGSPKITQPQTTQSKQDEKTPTQQNAPQQAPVSKGSKSLDQLRIDYLSQVSRLTHYWDKKRMFANWIKLAEMSKFRQRIYQITIAVNPKIDAVAMYQPFWETITLKDDPADYHYDTVGSGTSWVVLWHEAIHAISHGHENGSLSPPRPFQGAPVSLGTHAGNKKETEIDSALEAIDHLYIGWAENCITAIPFLERIEDIMKANGKDTPPEDVQKKSQELWAKVLEAANYSVYGELPNERERKELEDMTGFRFDVNEILNGYLSLDYPIEYFVSSMTDDQIWALFPTSAQVGMEGVKPKLDKSKSDNLSATYTKGWGVGISGRHCVIHLTLYGSDEISREVWNALRGTVKGETVKNVGDDAYIMDLGSDNSYRAVARFRNASVMMTDCIFNQTSDGIKVTRLPVNWNYVKWIFKNMEALPAAPVPAGVETSIEKLRK